MAAHWRSNQIRVKHHSGRMHRAEGDSCTDLWISRVMALSGWPLCYWLVFLESRMEKSKEVSNLIFLQELVSSCSIKGRCGLEKGHTGIEGLSCLPHEEEHVPPNSLPFF